MSHLPLPRDHPAEGHSPLFLAVRDVPLPLLRRQHQDRFPGCDGKEGAAPRQSQLKGHQNWAALPLSALSLSPSKGPKLGSDAPLIFAEKKDSLNRTAGGFGCRLVVLWPDRAGSERVSIAGRWEFRHCKQMMCTTYTVGCI